MPSTTTKTRVKTTEALPADPVAAAEAEAEKAAAAARDAAAKAEAARTEKTRQRAALEAARQPHIAVWEERERQAFPDRWRGQVDQARAEFVAAVRDGGDAVAAWTRWRITRRLSAADRAASERWLAGQAKRAYETELAAWKPLYTEATALDGQRHRAPGNPQLRERLVQLLDDVAAFTGTPVTVTKSRNGEEFTDSLRAVFVAITGHRPEPPKKNSGGIGTSREVSFADDLSRVVRQLESEAVAAAEKDRQQRREAYVQAQLG